MKHTLIFIILLAMFSNTSTAKEIYPKKELKSINLSKSPNLSKEEFLKQFNFMVYEFIQQNKFRNGYGVKNLYWSGPMIEFMGRFNLSVLRGSYTKMISGKIYNSTGYRFGFGFDAPFPLFTKRGFNIIPSIGMGFAGQYGVDPNVPENPNFNFDVGLLAHLNAGVSVVVGPVKLGVKYRFETGYSSKRVISKATQMYPTLTVSFSPQLLLMNPRVFTHSGMATYVENYKKTTIEGYDKTTTIQTWDEISKMKDVKVNDVAPFFFIGPRVLTNFTTLSQTKFISSYGFNIGARAGGFYINGLYDKGSFYFKEPFKVKREIGNTKLNEVNRHRFDGYFNNSSRIGAEIGTDLVMHFIKSNYNNKSSFANKTSLFACILKIGYFQQKNGSIEFLSDSGSFALSKDLLQRNVTGVQNDARLSEGKKLNALNFGLTLCYGAVAFNYDYYSFKNNRPLSHAEFSMSYHYPISRLIRAINVHSKSKKSKS